MNKRKDFINWIRTVINPQAGYGNNICLDDYSKDGMSEYLYPVRFTVKGDSYSWTVIKQHTKGRHLCNHYELWFTGKAFGTNKKIATGVLDKTKLRKGLREIYNFYNIEKESKLMKLCNNCDVFKRGTEEYACKGNLNAEECKLRLFDFIKELKADIEELNSTNQNLMCRLNFGTLKDFNPLRYIVKSFGEDGNEYIEMPVKYRKLWFHLLYPNGVIRREKIKDEENLVMFRARVYKSNTDHADLYIGEGYSQRAYDGATEVGRRYIEDAETNAIGRALSDAGFDYTTGYFMQEGSKTPPDIANSALFPDNADEADSQEEKTDAKKNEVVKEPEQERGKMEKKEHPPQPQENLQKDLPESPDEKEAGDGNNDSDKKDETINQNTSTETEINSEESPATSDVDKGDPEQIGIEAEQEAETPPEQQANPNFQDMSDIDDIAAILGLEDIDLGDNPFLKQDGTNVVDFPGNKKASEQEAGNVTKYDHNTPVDKIIELMTLEDAKNLVISGGHQMDKTMIEVYHMLPQYLFWYVNEYSGDDNRIRAAAKILIEAYKLEQKGA